MKSRNNAYVSLEDRFRARIEKHIKSPEHFICIEVEHIERAKNHRFWLFYKDARWSVRWKYIGGNGAIMQASSESFSSFGAAAKNAKTAGFRKPAP